MESTLEFELNESQAAAIAQVMLAVAHSDGEVDPRELSLIEELAPADLGGPAPDPAAVAELFTEPGPRDLLIRSALLVALVDQSFSDKEREVIGRYASALGFSDEEFEQLSSDVKAYLMSPLIGLSNTSSVAEVSKNLKI